MTQLENLKIVVDTLAKKIKTSDLTHYDARQFDNAFNAISLQELDLVIENTTSRSVQDYAIVKRRYFMTKIDGKFHAEDTKC